MADVDLLHEATCAVKHSQSIEDLDLIPILIQMMGGKPGTFLEIGGADGITSSQTFLLEKCFNWTGILVEAHPDAFRVLQRNRPGPLAHNFHAAACKEPGYIHVAMGISRTGVSAALELNPSGCKKQTAKHYVGTTPKRVECREVRSLVSEVGFHGIDFASIDVEGAEDIVLDTLDLSTTKVILVEAERCAMEKNKKVHRQLIAAGFVQLHLGLIKPYAAAYTELYVREGIVDNRPWRGLRHGILPDPWVDFDVDSTKHARAKRPLGRAVATAINASIPRQGTPMSPNLYYQRFPIPSLAKALDGLAVLRGKRSISPASDKFFPI